MGARLLALVACAFGRPQPGAEKLSLFNRERSDEALYDRYALALAATERARELRDEALERSAGRFRWSLCRRFGRRNVCDPRHGMASNPRWRSACSRHAVVSARIIDGVAGLSVAEFNRLSRLVAASPTLKKKVLHQAYVYRVASKIDDKRDAEIGSPPLDDGVVRDRPDSMRSFASLAQKVEHLRQQQRADLVAALGVDDFPDYPICDPRVLPFMSKRVQDVCAAFPARAADIVRSHGIDFESFERLLARADRDPFFRWRLARAMRQLENQRRQHTKPMRPPPQPNPVVDDNHFDDYY